MPDVVMAEPDGPPPAKLSRSELYKPPTNEELADLHETEMLFHSNLVKLQIAETLNEVSISEQKRKQVDGILHSIHDAIMKIPATESALLQKPTWLDTSVVLPFVRQPIKVKGNMPFLPPSEIKVVGSYQLDTTLKQNLNVDLLLIMPKGCFQAKDHLNQRYLRKHALYLTHVAANLSSNSLIENVQFSYFMDDTLKPIVMLTPAGNLQKSLTIRLHAGPGEECLKIDRFAPSKSNLRLSWFFGSTEKDESFCPSPHYNSCIMMDLLMESHLYFLYDTANDFRAFKDAVRLLKVWLHQRSLDQGYGSFNGFLMSMLLSYLLHINKISKLMSSYQIVRNTFQYLAISDWTGEGVAFDKSEDYSLFHQHYEVVFMDPTGKLNLCANMSSLMYKQVCHEAKLSLDALDSKNCGFAPVFMQPVKFAEKFDQIVELGKIGAVKKVVEKLGLQSTVMDQGGNCLTTVFPYFAKLLSKGLGNRVHQLGVLMHSFNSWNIGESPPTWKEVSQGISFGLILNRTNSSEVLERGPSADSAEASGFREFWGEKSELRRFKDGAICEAVVWNCSNSAEKREIPMQICKYLLKKHCDISQSALVTHSSKFDDFISIPRKVLKSGTEIGFVGTGDEINLEVVLSYNELCLKLRNLKSLPLSITNLQGISPVLRYTEVFPPCRCQINDRNPSIIISGNTLQVPVPAKKCPSFVAPIEIICHMEGSGKWPQEAQALRRLKAAFHLAMSDELKRQFPELACVPSQSHIDVMMNGFVFRVCIAYQREVNVLQTHKTPDGMVKIGNTPESLALAKRTVHLPQLASALHGLRQRHASFGETCRLAKRWINSHLLSRHISTEALELVVASLFTNPFPYTEPGSGQSGFLRFLRFWTTFDFAASPLVVDINNDMSGSDVDAILTGFKQHRQTLPPLAIMTSQDRTHSMWTSQSPGHVILRRLRDLARLSLQNAESRFALNGTDEKLAVIFTPSLGAYDVVIRLKARWLPRRHEQSAKSHAGAAKKECDFYEEQSSKVLPVVGFDPVQFYLDDLEDSFGDLALFFHDVNGGDVIGVLWRPNAFSPKPFKIATASRIELTEDGKCSPNVRAILEDFKALGCGLVESIQVDTEKWKF